MTVAELIKELASWPQGAKVVMAEDAEGNGFSPLEAINSGAYFADSTWSGEFHEDGQDDAPGEDRVVAICLWPVN